MCKWDALMGAMRAEREYARSLVVHVSPGGGCVRTYATSANVGLSSRGRGSATVSVRVCTTVVAIIEQRQ